MKRAFACVLVAWFALAACGSSKTSEVKAAWGPESTPVVSQGEKTARVVGHVLDRGTGEPIGGARIEAPGGRTAVSDSAGYFEITGFRLGEEGELRATWGQEKKARTTLRPLEPGTLEVVLHLGS